MVGSGPGWRSFFLSLCVVWLDFFDTTARFGKEVQAARPQPATCVPGYLHKVSTESFCSTVFPQAKAGPLDCPSLPPLHAMACLLKIRSLTQTGAAHYKRRAMRCG